jgi:hypothetical protein
MQECRPEAQEGRGVAKMTGGKQSCNPPVFALRRER